MSKTEFEYRKKLKDLEHKIWRDKIDYMSKVNVGLVIGGSIVLLGVSLIIAWGR